MDSLSPQTRERNWMKVDHMIFGIIELPVRWCCHPWNVEETEVYVLGLYPSPCIHIFSVPCGRNIKSPFERDSRPSFCSVCQAVTPRRRAADWTGSTGIAAGIAAPSSAAGPVTQLGCNRGCFFPMCFKEKPGATEQLLPLTRRGEILF